MKSLDELYDKNQHLDLKAELDWVSKNVHSGYLSNAQRDYIRWLAFAALMRIMELEGGELLFLQK